MKRRTDWQAQQYRIRHEYAQKCALEAWERMCEDRARLMNGRPFLSGFQVTDLPLNVEDVSAALAQKH